MTILSWDAFLIKVHIVNAKEKKSSNNIKYKTCTLESVFWVCWIFLGAGGTCNMQPDPPPACAYQALAAASCEVTMADSLQVTAINNTEISDMWFCVRQSEKKTGGKNETASCCD